MKPTEEQIKLIRQQTDDRTINVRAWADVLDVSLETIRRIGRRDTYRQVDRPVSALVRSLPPSEPAIEQEPSPEAITESLARLRALMPDAGGLARESLGEIGRTEE